jgi:hypothetical protein
VCDITRVNFYHKLVYAHEKLSSEPNACLLLEKILLLIGSEDSVVPVHTGKLDINYKRIENSPQSTVAVVETPSFPLMKKSLSPPRFSQASSVKILKSNINKGDNRKSLENISSQSEMSVQSSINKGYNRKSEGSNEKKNFGKNSKIQLSKK